jgi:hypothetical protein
MVPACGDELLCPTPALLLIDSPTTVVSGDSDDALPGVQTEVAVRSTLPEGSVVELIVRDEAEVETVRMSSTVGEAGDLTFVDVTVPLGRIEIEATTASDRCGRSSDVVALDVVTGLGCELVLAPMPVVNDFYAPVPVLHRGLDPNPTTADFELAVSVVTAPGWDVELLRTVGGREMTVGETTANVAGTASFGITLPQGDVALRALCRGDGADGSASLTSPIFVDTIAPTCAMSSPLPGSTITPSYDQNGDLDDGVQLAMNGAIGGDDVLGEPATFLVTPEGEATIEIPGTPVDDDGTTASLATLDPATTPAVFEIGVRAIDHAGNPCETASPHTVAYDACDLDVVAPTGPVNDDADGDPGNGSQLDASLQISDECVGRLVTSNCGLAPPSGTVPPGGALDLRVSMCATSPCEAETTCSFNVSTIDGVETRTQVHLVFDDVGPAVSVAVVSPVLACGSQVTAAADTDPATAGVQVVARVTATGAVTRSLELVNADGTSVVDAAFDVPVTLAPGTNALRGLAEDDAGNLGASPPCAITLADLTVSFGPPAADGRVGRDDGVVSGPNLTFDLCGTVSATGASVTIALDGGPAQPATVVGTTWCRSVTLDESPPTHTVVATAIAPPSSFGQSTLLLLVDLTAPGAITDLVATAPDRQRLHLTWTAPADGAGPVDEYVVKVAQSPITDGNFDAIGEVLPTGVPGNPGTPEQVDLFPARTGTTYWVAIAARDLTGNRSPAAISGPITPDFDQTGAIVATGPNNGNLTLGWSIASGRFDDDMFFDVAIGAPGEDLAAGTAAGTVRVYFGNATGIAATPDLTIEGVAMNGRLGSGVTALPWSAGGFDDLVVSAPGVGGGAGAIYVFDGGASFPTGTVTPAAADIAITVDAANPGWFAGAAIGSTLAAARFDDDATPDLVLAAPNGGGTRGGIAIIYGGTITTPAIALSETDPGPANGAVITLIEDPTATVGARFGTFAHVVGATEGVVDATDDVVVAYADTSATGDAVYVFRPDGTRPATPGVTQSGFVADRDVRIEYVTTDGTTQLGAQATTTADRNGDGARELVLSAHLDGSGRVVVIDGDTVGTGGVAQTSTAGVVLTTFSGGGGVTRLGVAVVAVRTSDADVDGDGIEDLMIGALSGAVGRLFVWFGDEIPAGSTTVASASHALTGPPTFTMIQPSGNGPAAQAAWVGDTNNDGLDDVCWSSPNGNSRDGSFEVLWDDGN